MHLHNFIQLQNISNFSLRENRHWGKNLVVYGLRLCVFGEIKLFEKPLTRFTLSGQFFSHLSFITHAPLSPPLLLPMHWIVGLSSAPIFKQKLSVTETEVAGRSKFSALKFQIVGDKSWQILPNDFNLLRLLSFVSLFANVLKIYLQYFLAQ